jgi:tetratricopeptide (TPR) repeat protein
MDVRSKPWAALACVALLGLALPLVARAQSALMPSRGTPHVRPNPQAGSPTPLSVLPTSPGWPRRPTPTPPDYAEAIELMHSPTRTASDAQRLQAIVMGLQARAPRSGLAEALTAEFYSSASSGTQPDDASAEAVRLADAALSLDPTLALPHIAKARIDVRLGRFDEAAREIALARRSESRCASCFFFEGQMYQRQKRWFDAYLAYDQYVSTVPSRARKANGYSMMAETMLQARRAEPQGGPMYLQKAEEAYGKMLATAETFQGDVNYAIFLNRDRKDYAGAERYARRALAIGADPLASLQLAAAQYQQLLAGLPTMGTDDLRARVGAIGSATGVSLGSAIANHDLAKSIRDRLQAIADRVGGA